MSDFDRDEPELSTLSIQNRIDEVCDSFESAYLRDEKPEIGQHLALVTSKERARLFRELMLIEVHFSKARGSMPDWERYVADFPQFGDVVESVRMHISSLQDTTKETRCASNRLRPGSQIGRFTLVERLGQGAVGDVWKARDCRLQRLVAIKFPRSLHISEVELQRFLREGKAAARLRHPAIVTIHEIARDGELVFIVSDYVEGENLRERLDRGPIGFDESAQICAELADALQVAHANGIVHRDLKPANVLLDANGFPHLTDFGLAKWAEDNNEVTLAGELLGTPAYMAPEQAAGRTNEVDARTDVYSLGTVLYELLCGCRPFSGDRGTVISKILTSVPPTPRQIVRQVPRELDAICRKAIEKLPRDRYQSATEMADDLRRYLKGEPVVARRLDPANQTWHWLKRRRVGVSAVLLATLTVVSLAVAARSINRANELLGLRDIQITTRPPGARLTFVPLDNVTGDPDGSRTNFLPGVSPISASMAPGDYWVVAVLEDGRFHEVLRHVPEKRETLPGVYKHNRWKASDGGEVVLPDIAIPDIDIADGMTLIEDGKPQRAENSRTHNSTETSQTPKPFYVDPVEFTFAEYVALRGDGPRDLRMQPLTSDAAVTVSYDDALSLAEAVGKRLPTAAELEFAATACGTTKYPWGNESIEAMMRRSAPAREHHNGTFDVLAFDPPVCGLCSDVAEWTISKAPSQLPSDLPMAFDRRLAEDYRLIKGGSREVIDNPGLMSTLHRDPRDNLGVSRFEVRPGIGFRCVRSATPRYQEIHYSGNAK
jgi:serine/threonine protein kinase